MTIGCLKKKTLEIPKTDIGTCLHAIQNNLKSKKSLLEIVL